jgi:Kef-type K+ transport system membrane component KefB
MSLSLLRLIEELYMDYLPLIPTDLDLLGRIAVLLASAVACAELGNRFLRLPRVVGYLVAGLLLGPGVLGWISESLGGSLRPLMLLALGLLLFELGSRVDLRWLRHNPMLLASSLFESGLTFLSVYIYLSWFDLGTAATMTIASIAVATSPAVVMRIVSENNARGQLTQRLLLLTALNCLYSIILLKVSLGFIRLNRIANPWDAIVHPLYVTVGSLMLGGCLAYGIRVTQELALRRDSERFTLVIALLLIGTTVAEILRLSVPMAMLCGGMILRSLTSRLQVVPEHFGSAGAVLVIILFTLTGVALDPRQLANGGLIALGVLMFRLAGKYVGAYISAGYGGLSPHKAPWLAIALLPMSSLAVLQAHDISTLYADFGKDVLEIVLGAVLIMELLGPVLTQLALRKVGESFSPSNR